MRIVFASLGSLGDLHPLLALAEECKRRGHQPVIAASPCYIRYVADLGFEAWPIRPDIEPSFPVVQKLGHPRLGPERLLRDVIFPASKDTMDDLCLAAEGADILVVGELLYVAPLVGAKLGIPWVNAILSPTSFLSSEDPCVLAPLPILELTRRWTTVPHRFALEVGRFLTDRWARPLHKLHKELGVPEIRNPVFAGKHSPELVLALFPSFFSDPQSDWPSSLLQTGFPFFSQRVDTDTESKIRDFLDAGKPPVLFTLGSAMVHIADNFYSLAALAAQDVGCRAILLLGSNPEPPDLPREILALKYAPLELVVPGSAVVVHHGGIGTCGMTLRHGIPSLVIPFGYDQPDNAERLRRLGVARVLPRNRVSQGSITAKLKSILSDPSMATKAREYSGRIRPDEELTRSIDAIEAVVSKKTAKI